MECYHPLSAFKTAAGEVVFKERGDIVASLFLPCGQCMGCRLERSRQWATRVMHEASLYQDNCWITLTYNEDNFPKFGTLVYSHFQRFMRDLRKKHAVRFFMCGEYGEDFDRPHFHAVIFGFAFRGDRIHWKKSRGFNVDRSVELESLWTYGHSYVGELSFEFAAYIARYICKKVCGDSEKVARHYRKVNFDTGEIVWREPEFIHMSLKPGIGARWLERWGAEVYPDDRVVSRGVPCKPPKYYDVLAKRIAPDMIEEVKMAREARARERGDNSPERLAVKEAVTINRVKYYKRSVR